MEGAGEIAGRSASLLVLVLAMAAACADGGRAPPPDAPAAPAPPPAAVERPAELLEPLPGRTFERELLGGDVHAYRLPLEPGVYLEVTAEQRGVDLVLVLLAADGEELIRTDSPTGSSGVERLRAVTAAAGEHRLEVRAPGRPGTGGVYLLKIEAARVAGRADRRRFEADRRFAQAEALRRQGDAESSRRALAAYREALAAAEELGDRDREAHVHQRLGWLLRKNLDRQREAEPHYRRAAALFAETGDAWNQAGALNNLGRVQFELGETEAAFASWQQALPLWRQAGDEGYEAATLNNLGVHYMAHGVAGEALDFLDRALDRLRQIDSPVDELRVLRNRAGLYRTLGKDREALDDLEESLRIARRLGDGTEEATGLTALGQVYGGMGETKRAREVLERALALEEGLGRKRGVALALRGLARIEADLGRPAAARRSLERARTLFRELEDPRDEAAVEARLGRLLAETGHPAEALVSLGRARALFAELGDPDGEVSSLLGTARAERALGRLVEARDHAEQALARIEELRGHVGGRHLRSAYLARQIEHFDFLVDLLMELHRREPGAGHDSAAFAVSERSRARSLLESLIASRADLTQDSDLELPEQEEELGRRLAALELQRQELLAEEVTPEQTAAVEVRLRRAIQDYHRVRSRIRERLVASVDLPRPLTAAEVRRRVLDGETLLLEYDLGPERSVLWALGADRAASYELPARSEIEAAAREAHLLLAESDLRGAWEATARALAGLGEMLLGPVAGELEDYRRLVIVPEGALHYLPFSALTLPAETGGEMPLLARHEVVTMPSASALAALRRRLADRRPAPGAAVVVADPVFEAADPRLPLPLSNGPADPRLPRLEHSGREAEAILSLLPPGGGLRALGFEASRETVLSPALRGFRILHFATHGQRNAEHPELSYLMLSRFDSAGRPREGALYAHEIHGLELPAELVVLSGCRTALGKEVKGEGLVGLPQAFFDAGAARVLVSLWQVDDEATAELMARFYRALFSEGIEPAAALREAQRAVRAVPGWEAPYYWAGFVLQGDWRWSGEADGG